MLHDGYGLTEAAPVVTVNALGPEREKPVPGSVGRPLPGVEVELRDADGDQVDDGDPGRIFVRGANLFSGYWPDGRGGPDADGWFGTGDIAVADADGELHLVGRSTDTGDRQRLQRLPGRGRGGARRARRRRRGRRRRRSDDRDRRGGARLRRARRRAPRSTGRGCSTAAARSLARFKLPPAIEIVAALPHTVTGKIMKWQLGEPAEGGERERG